MRGALIAVLLIVASMATSVAAAPRRSKPADQAAAPAAVPATAPATTPDDARAAAPATPPRQPGPDDAKVVAILDKIAAAGDAAARKAAIAELTEIAPRTIDAIAGWLARERTADVEGRREVLTQINASVPDKAGRFTAPARQTGKEKKADDEVDWLAALIALDPATAPSPAALAEVIADVAAIRALSASRDVRAAQVIFDTAFADATMIYRDECGRYLRKMEPASIPALTRESQTGGGPRSTKNADRRRYATWQLERLDRQEPSKALDAALGDEALAIAILEAFRVTHHREAVHAVWRRVNADAPRVRAAARATWMDYITGPPPPPAPRAKLNLPGGKKTKKAKPLWLTYRELADNELRKAANELLGENYPIEDPMSIDDKDDDRPQRPPTRIDLEEVTRRLFAHFDGERAKQDAAQWADAQRKARSGELAAATELVDRMLATNPDRGQPAERAEMARLYLAWGKQLEASQRWADAAAAFSKAHGLDPRGAQASDALAGHHFALGKSLESAGKDGGPDFRRAVALKPDYAPARTAAAAVEIAGAPRPVWMLYAAAIAAAAAAIVFAAAVLRRRA